MRQYGVYTFFLTCSVAELEWPYIIQVTARQYGEELSVEEINAMDCDTKCSYLKIDPVTAACLIDYVFKNLWGKVILSGMHPIGQILDYDNGSEYQGRGTQYFHAPIMLKMHQKLVKI